MGAAAGSGAITGFPTIWAQNIKDVEIRHAGQPVTVLTQIGEQATKDLGFKVTMQASENADLINRYLTQSANIDVGDVSLAYMKYLIGRGILQTIPVAKFKQWDATLPLFTKSRLFGRPQGLDRGHRALQGAVCDRRQRRQGRAGADRVPERRADHHQRRHARRPPRPHWAARHQLGGPAEPRVQGQGGAAGQPDRSA